MYSIVHIHNNYCVYIYIHVYLRFLTVYVSPDMKSFFLLQTHARRQLPRQKMILRCLVVFSIALHMSFTHNINIQEHGAPLLPWPSLSFDTKGSAQGRPEHHHTGRFDGEV